MIPSGIDPQTFRLVAHASANCTTVYHNRHEYQEYFLRGKVGRCLGLTTLAPSCADGLEIWVHRPSGTFRACPGLYRDCLLCLSTPSVTKRPSVTGCHSQNVSLKQQFTGNDKNKTNSFWRDNRMKITYYYSST